MEHPQLFVVSFILLAALAGAQRPPEFNTQYCGEYHNNISGLTDELRLLIIQQHNVYRSYLANGNVPGECGEHPTCKNVYTLQYQCENEAAATAQYSPTCGLERLANQSWPPVPQPEGTLPAMCGAVDNPQFMKSTTRPGLVACVGHVSYTKTYKKGELTNRQFVLLALEQMWEESKEQINSTFWDHLTLAHMLYGKNYGVACGITECAPAAADSVTRTFSCSYQTFHTHWHSKAKYVGPPPAGQQCVPGTTCEIGRICDAGANCRVDGCAKTIHMSSVCHEPSGLCDHSMLGYEYQAGQWGARVHCWQYAGPYNGTCVLDGNSNCICE